MSDFAECRNRALNLLARREHSQRELRNKLLAKAFDASLITAVTDELAAQNLLSDERFAKLYIEQRSRRGYGPMRIQQELHQRGIAPEFIEQALSAQQNNWAEYADLAWNKYLRTYSIATDSKKFKFIKKKFLYNRGFG